MSNYNLEINQGSSYSITIQALDSDGIARNLSGYSIRGYIKPYYSSTGYTAFSGVWTTAVSGISSISLTSAQTALLPAGYSVYDLEAYTTGISGIDNSVIQYSRGYVQINPESTI